MKQELLTLPEHVSSRPVFSELLVTPCILLCVCFVDHWLFCCPFSFGQHVDCSSIYGFPVWYLHTLLKTGYLYFIYSVTERRYHLFGLVNGA